MRITQIVLLTSTKIITTALLTAFIASNAAASITVPSDLQGWVNNVGGGNGASNNNNTFTGVTTSGRYNSWASFDMSSYSGTVVSASLEILLAPWPTTSTTPRTVGIFDVSTPSTAFFTSTSGVAGYTDLGSGHQYGTVVGHNELHIVPLSAQAAADITASLGDRFELGFTNFTANALPTTAVNGIYSNGNQGGYPRLILEFGDAAGGTVPEASSLLVWGSLVSVVGVYWSRRPQMAERS